MQEELRMTPEQWLKAIAGKQNGRKANHGKTTAVIRSGARIRRTGGMGRIGKIGKIGRIRNGRIGRIGKIQHKLARHLHSEDLLNELDGQRQVSLAVMRRILRLVFLEELVCHRVVPRPEVVEIAGSVSRGQRHVAVPMARLIDHHRQYGRPWGLPQSASHKAVAMLHLLVTRSSCSHGRRAFRRMSRAGGRRT